ncbi:hypothetical protein [Solirubrobacter deserti]|uniref:Secreted protein n=1 Tax=Solirubrobacter deserti TaxID=2282478 RepID=A0ABT4RQQ9_9ACTN|nr:hypothetical protein [Solirubrobacter deserti]MDA0140904.1 hypothetical protein [Solirubrobacter deserti]
MTVALSIVLAAVVGGLVFMLLDNWQRKRVAPVVAAPRVADADLPPLWTPEPDTFSSWQRPSAAATEAETRPLRPWPPEEDTRPLPREPREPEPPRREPPKPLWTPPPGSSSGRWDDDDRYRGHERDRDDEDDPPPGLWSGWARR